MGCCLSKTTPSPPPLSSVEPDTPQPDTEPQEPQMPPTQLEKKEEREGFVIQHRKSHDKKLDSDSDSGGVVLVQSINSSPTEGNASNIVAMTANGSAVRTSSCTKEEVDAILIQCGRLSRSNSGKCGGSAASGSARKYSGSKRSHDFDKESNNVSVEVNCTDGGVADDGDERLRRRQSRGSHRRTTPSRSRERDPHSQRSGGGGGRRVSRSPGRRSESPNTGGGCNSNGSTTTAGSNNNGGGGGGVGCGRPGKMVSVPATITSLTMDKSNNNGEGGGGNSGSVKRVLVRRNVTPPRSRSPARSALVGGATGVKNQPSPSRNSSRKAEHSPGRKHSPYRRTPLTDLDMNSLPFQPLANKSSSIKGQPLSSVSQNKVGAVQGTHRRARSRGGEGSDLAQVSAEQSKATGHHDEIAAPVPQTLSRSRSLRRSRDFDVNVEATQNPNPAANYNSLLLQDIQSFHQKASAPAAPSFKLPECVSKACSIVEAVADLHLSSSNSSRPVGRVNAGDELMEPSLHKFVTVGGGIDGEFDEQESTGSNSFVTGGGGSPTSFHRLASVSQASSSHRSARSRGPGAGR